MISDIHEYLRYFDGVNRRAVRDVSALPAEAETWKPQAGEGEEGWGVGEIVGHMAASRLFFVSAYEGAGWVAEQWPNPTMSRHQWVTALNESAATMGERLAATAPDQLSRRVESIDTPGRTFSAWRLLMMLLEHDVHHRSQIQTYAGVMGWPVQHIFGRSAEEVGLSGR
jgi:uncharacterized damage-inducible protein DinB